MRALFTSCLAVLLAAPVFAQPPGGRGERGGGERGGFGGMRGGGGADGSFNRLIQSYGGNGDTLDYSRIPPETREFVNRMTPNDPMPASGTISRAQYADVYSKRMEAMRANGFGGGGNGFGRGPGGGERGERAAMEEARAKADSVRVSGGITLQGAPGQPTVIHGLQPPQPGMNIVISGPGGMPGSPPGGPERQASEEEVQGLIRRYDNDKDGRMSMEEANRTDRLKYNFAHYDANKDGYIDINEGRVYMNDRANNRVPQPDNATANNWQGGGGGNNWGGGGGGGWGGGGNGGRENNPIPEEAKPVVYRYGNLPTGLPGWFSDIDFDKDGQIGLYEWREAKKPVSEYVSMDLNGDGLLPAEEYLRFKKLLSSEEGKMSSGGSNANKGNGRDTRNNGGSIYNWPPRNGGDNNTKKEERREKGERNDKSGGDKNNPFRKN